MSEPNESVLWWEFETDLGQMLQDRRYAVVSRYAAENTTLLLHKWTNETYEDLERSVRYGDSIMEFFCASIKKNTKDRALFDLGGLFRAVKIFAVLLFNLGISHRLEERQEKELSGVKHLEDIIRALETHGSMTHTELSVYLQMNPSTLTEAMKKILETGTIQAISSGKYRLYSLTDTGVRLGRQLRRKPNAKSAEEHINALREILEKIPEGEGKKQLIEEISLLLPTPGGMMFYTGDHLTYYTDDGVPGRKEAVNSMITLIVREGDKKVIFAKPEEEIFTEEREQFPANLNREYTPKRILKDSLYDLLSRAIG